MHVSYASFISTCIFSGSSWLELHQSTGIILQKEHVHKNKAPSLRSKRPQRQEQEGSTEESGWASHVGNRLAVLSIKGHLDRILGLERQEQDAPLLKVHPFLLCAMTVAFRATEN